MTNPYAAITHSICPPVSQATVGSLLAQYDNLSAMVNPHQQAFYQELKRQTQANFSAEALMEKARMAAGLSTGVGRETDTTVYEITELGVMQSAQGYMRSVIMATPMMREYHDRQLVDSYAGLYEYQQPNAPAHMDRVYAEVTNGVFVEGGVVRHYYSNTPLRELSSLEKAAALKTMKAVTEYLLAGEDPSQL